MSIRLTEAQVSAIKTLENEHGQITPRQVVQAARDRHSPLHDLFDWNVKTAAEKWWMHRARVIIGAVEIHVTTETFSYKTSAYMVDTTVDGQGYRATYALKGDTANARDSLIYTLETAAGHLRRALDLAVPLGLSGDIDDLLLRVAGVQRVVQNRAA
jgi:hypothetical protein